MSKLYVDLDGVLGDTLGYASLCFGGTWDFEENFKELIPKINEHGRFYLDQPLMPDAEFLWGCLEYLEPVILTGIHSAIPNMAEQKIQWAKNHFGSEVKIICCKSTEKHKFGKPMDVLIDDRLKYRELWTGMGGIFIHHKSAVSSLAALAAAYRTLGVYGH